jgi:hypothetical protein
MPLHIQPHTKPTRPVKMAADEPVDPAELPCKNSSCPSFGRPHPRCKCYLSRIASAASKAAMMSEPAALLADAFKPKPAASEGTPAVPAAAPRPAVKAKPTAKTVRAGQPGAAPPSRPVKPPPPTKSLREAVTGVVREQAAKTGGPKAPTTKAEGIAAPVFKPAKPKAPVTLARKSKGVVRRAIRYSRNSVIIPCPGGKDGC